MEKGDRKSRSVDASGTEAHSLAEGHSGTEGHSLAEGAYPRGERLSRRSVFGHLVWAAPAVVATAAVKARAAADTCTPTDCRVR